MAPAGDVAGAGSKGVVVTAVDPEGPAAEHGVFAATAADLAEVPKTPRLASQRTPKDFRNPVIKTDRPLRRDPGYRPEFPNTPIVVTELPVSLSPEEVALFNVVKRSDIYRDDDAAALRDLLFSWWEERFLQADAGAPSIESP